MNAIAAIATRMQARHKAAPIQPATGTALPDFAALLGQVLNAGQAQAGRANAIAPVAASATIQQDSGAASGSGIQPASETTDALGNADGGDADVTMAMAQGQLGNAPATRTKAPADVFADQQGNTPKAPIKLNPQANTARTTAGAGTANTPENPKSPQAWNVHELAHQIKAAAGEVNMKGVPENAAASATGAGTTGSAVAPGASLTSFAAQAESDKMRTAGTQNLLHAAAGQAPSAPRAGAVPPVEMAKASANVGDHNPGLNKAGAEIFKAILQANAKDSAHLESKDIAQLSSKPDLLDEVDGSAGVRDAADAVSVSSTNESRQPLVFEAGPSMAPQGTHAVAVAEQMRQVSDWLADRADGAIKLGDRGVEANLKLYPPDLGQVRVQMSVGPDRTTQAQFIVERPETAQLLQQHMRSFQQGLESHGLTVDRVQISVQSAAKPYSSGNESSWRPGQDSRRESLLDQRGEPRREREKAGQRE